MCTVQSDEVLERNGRRKAEDEASWVYGVAYEIPPEIRDEGRQPFNMICCSVVWV